MPTIALEKKISGRDSDSRSGLQFASQACLNGRNRNLLRPGLDLDAQQALVLEHREGAHRMARVLLRRWNVTMESEEIDSLADLALCKAARRFKPGMGASFSTYLFHYLHGALIRAISKRTSENWLVLSEDGNVERPACRNTPAGAIAQDQAQSAPSSPEKVLYFKELQQMYCAAVARLSPVELEVVQGVQIGEMQIAQRARECGYSRGHFSKILNGARRGAFRELHEELKEAA